MQITTQESLVFNIVRKYLNKKRVFNLEKMVPYIHSQLVRSSININLNGILIILEKLTEKKMILEGSKFTRDEILINSNRKIIYDYIVKHPGACYNQILTKLNFKNHVLSWHLDTLLKFQFIKTLKISNRRIYFKFDMDLTNIKRLYIKSREKAIKILNYLKGKKNGATKTNIANNLKIHMNTIKKYLESLENAELIHKEKRLKKNLYFFSKKPVELICNKGNDILIKEYNRYIFH